MKEVWGKGKSEEGIGVVDRPLVERGKEGGGGSWGLLGVRGEVGGGDSEHTRGR